MVCFVLLDVAYDTAMTGVEGMPRRYYLNESREYFVFSFTCGTQLQTSLNEVKGVAKIQNTTSTYNITDYSMYATT